MVEERDLPEVLILLDRSTNDEGSNVSNIPSSIMTLPAPLDQAFMPGPKNPLLAYVAATNASSTHVWHPQGTDLIDMNLPCGVFLVPERLVEEYRMQAQQNNRRVRILSPLPRGHGRIRAVQHISHKPAGPQVPLAC